MAYLPVLMIDHNVMRLHVTVHNALAMAVVEGLEELVDVVTYVDVVELGIEAAEVGVVHVLEYERRGLALMNSSQYSTIPETSHEEYLTWLSRTTSRRATMLGPPDRF